MNGKLIEYTIFFLIFWLLVNVVIFGLNYNAEILNLNSLQLEQKQNNYFDHVQSLNDSIVDSGGIGVRESVSTLKVIGQTLTFTGRINIDNFFVRIIFIFLFQFIPILIFILLIIDTVSDFFG